MALVEHELNHAAQATDAFGAPKFSRSTGRPVFTIRGHDGEEFVGVVRRYGADAAGIRAIVDAADLAPKFYPVLSSLERFWVAVFGAVAAGCGAEPFRLRSTASRRGLIV